MVTLQLRLGFVRVEEIGEVKDAVDQLVIADNQRGWQISICIDFTFRICLFFAVSALVFLILFTSPVSHSFYTVFIFVVLS